MEVQVPEINLSTGMGTTSDKEVLSVARLWIRQSLTSVLQELCWRTEWPAIAVPSVFPVFPHGLASTMMRVATVALGLLRFGRWIWEISTDYRWSHPP